MRLFRFSAALPAFIRLAHWLAISLLVASLWSGLNIAIDQRPWLKACLFWWPGISAPALIHLAAGCLWLALAASYWLHRDRTKAANSAAAKGLARHRFSIRLMQWFFLALALPGLLLLLNWWPSADFGLRWLHLLAAFSFVLLLLWHGLVQWQIGAWRRVRRPWFSWPQAGAGRSSSSSSSSALAISLLLAGGCASLALFALHRWQSSQVLLVPAIAGEMKIDGLDTEAQWQGAHSIRIDTWYGAPYERNVPLQVKMLHDGYSLYVHVKWPDPTRSMMHLPLLKTANGWKVQQSRLLQADEQVYYEDKFAVMLGREPWAALRSVFLQNAAGRGGHMTTAHNMVDVWHWKSVRNHQFGNLDDAFFGPALPLLPGQRRYTWGYASDPLMAGGYKENWAWFDPQQVTPLRLPRQRNGLDAFQAAASHHNHSPAMALDWHDTQPYTKELDTWPLGTIMPSVVQIHPNEGDRADVRARGVWKDGYWHLEMARGFETASTVSGASGQAQYDLKIEDDIYLWFSTFDHSQTRHTYHLRPVRLKLAPLPRSP